MILKEIIHLCKNSKNFNFDEKKFYRKFVLKIENRRGGGRGDESRKAYRWKKTSIILSSKRTCNFLAQCSKILWTVECVDPKKAANLDQLDFWWKIWRDHFNSAYHHVHTKKGYFGDDLETLVRRVYYSSTSYLRVLIKRQGCLRCRLWSEFVCAL